MVDKIFFPQPITEPLSNQGQNAGQTPKVSFEQVLAEKTLKFSRHAQEMVERREIELTPNRIDRITTAVQKATNKGARDSLILVDDIALLVSIKNRTVITAINGPNIKGNVFTNIDSAVIA